VLDAILGRPIDVDSIPLQTLAEGVTPGGPGSTIDLAGAGISPAFLKAMQDRPAVAGTRLDLLQEEEEYSVEEELEREKALAELMGGAPLRGYEDGAAGGAALVSEAAESYAVGDGFLRGV
jgi:DEAD/DEAH box helicase domain-containing protein